MPTIDDGGPAYPTDNEYQTGPDTFHFEGMTLRDYFAGQFLTGVISDGENPALKAVTTEGIEQERREYADGIAAAAYLFADAMLRARK